MALPATHIRFAAAVAGPLGVSDWPAYLSGTLYPDSRWVTGVDRQRTHASRFLDPGFAADDFTLGWHIHCVGDSIQGVIHTALFRGLERMTPEARWILLSAAKVVQDRCDAAAGNLGTYLPLLTHVQAPNGESLDEIEAYFSFVKQAYRSHHTPEWADYAELWSQVGLEPHRITRIEAEVGRLLADREIELRLCAAFKQMVARWTAAHGHSRITSSPAAVNNSGRR